MIMEINDEEQFEKLKSENMAGVRGICGDLETNWNSRIEMG